VKVGVSVSVGVKVCVSDGVYVRLGVKVGGMGVLDGVRVRVRLAVLV
jgi:hypothetical protein